MTVSLSSEIVPKIGEYERSATTVINSYTSPLLSGYVNKLYEGLSSKGLKNPASNYAVHRRFNAGKRS